MEKFINSYRIYIIGDNDLKIYKGQFTLKETLVASNDPTMRIASTPFGAPPGERTMYAGKGVPWKGAKGIEAVRRVNARVAAGIEKARDMSKAHREPGIAIIAYANGQVVTMPAKCLAMMEAAGHIVSVISRTAAVKRPWLQKVYVTPKK